MASYKTDVSTVKLCSKLQDNLKANIIIIPCASPLFSETTIYKLREYITLWLCKSFNAHLTY